MRVKREYPIYGNPLYAPLIDTCLDCDKYVFSYCRFLRRDRWERSVRWINFDFDALCKIAIREVPGATSITKWEKREGGFNRVFIFYTNIGKAVVAKLPFSRAGPARFTTHSEVATMMYRTFNHAKSTSS
jgi:hypothetical protein